LHHPISARAQIQANADGPARSRPLVAASVGCYGASLADGSEYRGDYTVTLEELKDFHRTRFRMLAEEQPDVFACETVPCLVEVEALLQLLLQVRLRWRAICQSLRRSLFFAAVYLPVLLYPNSTYGERSS